MTKKEIAEIVINTENLSKAQSERIITLIFDEIAKSLKSGEEVSIANFGKFSVAARDAREGINPATKAKITIAASKSAKFKQAKQLKESLN
ncbi:DNA-binding protein HU-beta [Williamsoniiplasma luminosum]|uniref:DNA-binding protein HU-beta n=1 Tax=Williamsoniiplasma luminosum TaxID=214888 RepID=A0A2K8NXG7_9MOLU|nr:HU family DNA-binding protein [Williamsoniiplasma luminosum]ATZ17441.1 DNA-binding protein HU-beta [Williamsoniiplasma luminosum]AVP49252.1 MAG: HU family DNA-binding protein [Williamsoniiplasma luminosum]